MKVKDAIKELQALDPEETIVLDYLTAADIVEDVQDVGHDKPTEEQTAAILDKLSNWQHIDQESIDEAIESVMPSEEDE